MVIPQEEQDIIERMIDVHGLALVTESIALICAEKAKHIWSNWQDREYSHNWTRAEEGLNNCVERIGV